MALSQIVNGDETGMRTLTEKGTKMVTVRTSGQEKTNVSVHLSCPADGTKLPMFVILQRKRKLRDLPYGVVVYYSESRYITQAGFAAW